MWVQHAVRQLTQAHRVRLICQPGRLGRCPLPKLRPSTADKKTLASLIITNADYDISRFILNNIIGLYGLNIFWKLVFIIHQNITFAKSKQNSYYNCEIVLPSIYVFSNTVYGYY